MNVVVFAVVYLALFLGFMNTLGSSLSNLAYNLVGQSYWMHTAIANLFLVCVAVGFIVGIVLVVRSGINRALRYFDLLLDSVSDILAKSDGPVMLPGELAPTAMALNTIKATSEQNERAAKAAEDRKNELVVYLAHDIKTPLTSIIGYLTLLEESPDLPLEVRERYTGTHVGQGLPARGAARRVLRDHALQPADHPHRALALRRRAFREPGDRGVLPAGRGDAPSRS